MAPELNWSNEEWRRLQTSLFAVTGSTRIRLSELTQEQWEQVVRDTRRSREDIDAALDAMLKRQDLPGGRVPVQTTERLFRESIPFLRDLFSQPKEEGPSVPTPRLEKILLAIESFNFATLPYDDLFLVWDRIGRSQGLIRGHECVRCVYSVLGQITHTQVQRMDASAQKQHRASVTEHKILNPPARRHGSDRNQSHCNQGGREEAGGGGGGTSHEGSRRKSVEENVNRSWQLRRIRGEGAAEFPPAAAKRSEGGGGNVVWTTDKLKGDNSSASLKLARPSSANASQASSRNSRPASGGSLPENGSKATEGIQKSKVEDQRSSQNVKRQVAGGGGRTRGSPDPSEAAGSGKVGDDELTTRNEGHASDGGSEDEAPSFSSSSFSAAAAADGQGNDGLLLGSNALLGGGSVAWSRRRLREVSSERRMPEQKPMLPVASGKGGKVSGLAGDPEIIFNLGGPILFTAPHSLNIVRGGKDGERKRIHKREKFSSEIVLKLAAFLEPYLGKPASYIIWNRMVARKGDPRHLDPNYLTQAQSPFSPWHHALHLFKDHWRSSREKLNREEQQLPQDSSESQRVGEDRREIAGSRAVGEEKKESAGSLAPPAPIFHVDIHGKMDRKDNLDLDIGMGPMENCWAAKGDSEKHAEFVALKEHLASGMREAFKGVKGKHFLVHGKMMPMTVEEDPYLNAYWGGSTFETISHQSVNLRIPAIQLEIPLTMRRELVRNDDLFGRFALAIFHSYKYMVSSFKSWEEDASSSPPVCGCARHLTGERTAEIRSQLMQDSEPACKTLEEVELALRELNHLERTIVEKQI